MKKEIHIFSVSGVCKGQGKAPKGQFLCIAMGGEQVELMLCSCMQNRLGGSQDALNLIDRTLWRLCWRGIALNASPGCENE